MQYASARLALGLVALGLVTLAIWLQNQYHLNVAIMVGIFAFMATGLNLLLG